MSEKRESFGQAYRLYIAGLTAAQRKETMQSIDEQRRTATKSQAYMLDCLQASCAEIWAESSAKEGT